MTGVITLAGIIVTFLTAVLGLVASLRNHKKIDEVHVLVNSQLQAVLTRVTQLTGALETAGVDVPPEPETA